MCLKSGIYYQAIPASKCQTDTRIQ